MRGKKTNVFNNLLAIDSNHHPPEGGSGPPKSIQKKLKKKTGWDWNQKAQENAEKAVVINNPEQGISYVIEYADGYYYAQSYSYNPYLIYTQMGPTIKGIISSYYKATNMKSPDGYCSNDDSSATSTGPIMPVPMPGPIPVPMPAPAPFGVPVFGF